MSQTADPARRVVITGLGCVTPLGLDTETTWDALVEGQSGVRPISRFDTAEYAVKIAAEVQGELNLGDVSPREARRMDRCILLALAAAREAISDASLAFGGSVGDRAGVAIGSGIGGLSSITSNQDLLREKGPRRVPPFTIPMGISNMSSGMISIQYGLRGPNLCHVSACTSGAHSIGEAARMIERGDVDVMLAGGTEAPIIELGIASFASMRALSTRNDDPAAASRPFDRGRDGFVMGEGAGVLVLESLAHARARGAHIRAELGGYAASADAANIAAPGENGAGPIAAMVQALADAGIDASQVEHVNAHATSTPAGDPVEAFALRAVLGDHVRNVPVSATKSMTGHLLGAAGAVEALFCVRVIETGVVPPTRNLEDPDPACELDHVVGSARETPVRVALSNSFGFGGTNASLVFLAFED